MSSTYTDKNNLCWRCANKHSQWKPSPNRISIGFSQIAFPMTVGHGRLWPNRLWPNRLWPAFLLPSLAKPTLARVSVLVVWPTLAKPTLAKPTLAKTDFGQNRLWPKRVWFVVCCVCVVLCVVCVAWVLFHGVRVGFHVWVLVSRFGLDSPSWDRPPFPWTALPLDRPSLGPPFSWTALPLDRPKFRSFFSLSRRKICSSLLSLGVFSLNFGVFWRPGRSTRWGSLVVVWNPGGPTRPGRRGSHTTPENSKRAHLSAPALQTPPKFHEKTSREGRKERIMWREREKKARNFGPPPFGAPPFGATLLGSTLLGSTLRAPTGFGPWLAWKKIQTIKNQKKQLKKSKQLTQKIQTIKNKKNN